MDLPDLKAKVKISTADVDVAEAKVKAFGQSVSDSMDRVGVESRMQSAGQAFIKFGSSGEVASVRISSATAKTRGDLDNLEARARKFADGLDESFRKGGTAVVKLGEDGEAAMSRFASTTAEAAQAVDSAIPLLSGLGSAAARALPMFASIGTTAAALVVPALIGTAVALSPVVVLLGAFTVGLTAALAVIGLAAGGVLALGAGVLLLGQRFAASNPQLQNAKAAQQQLTQATQAHQLAVQQLETLQNSLKGHRATAQQLQQVSDLQKQVTKTAYDEAVAQNAVNAAGTAAAPPLQRLQDHLGRVADSLGRQAAPMAALLASQLDKLIDPVGRLGSQVLSWFGERLPGIFISLQPFADKLAAPLNRLGQALSHFFDMVTVRSPALANVFGLALDATVAAVDGLLTNLLRLSDWFTERLPQFLPVVQSIMGGTGSLIQGVGQVAGGVVDWFLANWPKIAAAASWVWAQIAEGWNELKPALQVALPIAVSSLTTLFGYLAQHSDVLRTLFGLLGVAAGVVVLSITAVGVGAVAALAGLQWLYDAALRINQGFQWAGDQIGRFIGLLKDAASAAQNLGNWPGFSGAISALGGGRASGGPVLPNSVYTVGENGPETLVTGQAGGFVVPNGSSVEVSNLSTRRIERLLTVQNQLLASLAASSSPAAFSNRAYRP